MSAIRTHSLCSLFQAQQSDEMPLKGLADSIGDAFGVSFDAMKEEQRKVRPLLRCFFFSRTFFCFLRALDFFESFLRPRCGGAPTCDSHFSLHLFLPRSSRPRLAPVQAAARGQRRVRAQRAAHLPRGAAGEQQRVHPRRAGVRRGEADQAAAVVVRPVRHHVGAQRLVHRGGAVCSLQVQSSRPCA
jgi:hypothetical protein